MATFHRQESRLERTFYRALHELQRLRSLRPPQLALVSPKAEAIPLLAPRTNKIDHIPEPEPGPQPTLQVVPPPDDMQ